MDNLIQVLLNGYDVPVFLSEADRGTILFTNNAVEERLGFTKKKITGTRLEDLLQSDKIIWHQPVLEHNDSFYLVQSESLTLADTKFIKSVLKPFPDYAAISYFKLQKEMAGRIVHRLRSPLTGVSGFIELLKETALNDQQLKYLTAAKNGLDDLKSVLSQLKKLGEDVAVQQTTVNLCLLAEQIIDSLPAGQSERVKLHVDEDSVEIETDFILLKEIIEEMLANAFRHGAEGTPVNLHISGDRIRIHNAGVPIPPALAPNVFYPFFAGKARTMGIGLAKCAHYAFALGLDLKLARNTEEEGIHFDIIFSGTSEG